jgi:outer membrane protein assembly factor BamB
MVPRFDRLCRPYLPRPLCVNRARRIRFMAGTDPMAVAPLYVDGLVFDLTTSGELYALDGATGAVRWHAMTGAIADYGQLAVADGHVLVPTKLGVVAFGSQGAAATPTSDCL